MTKKSLLKQRDFTLLIFGNLVSLLGSNMQQFALSLYVLDLTGSATIFASILSISVIPRLILTPIAGVFGDWFDRKKSIVFLDYLNSGIIALFGILFFINGGLSVPLIYVFVILLEITEIFFATAVAGIKPSIVRSEDLLEANSLSSLVMSIGNLLAPVIGATIYVSFGMQAILIVNAIAFALSAFSEMFINVPKTNKKPDKISLVAFKKDFLAGLKIIRRNKFITTIIGLGTFVNFAISPLFSIGLIFITKEILGATDFQFGLFQAVFASSMIIAPIISSKFIKETNVGKICHRSLTIVGILVLIVAIVPTNLLISQFPSNVGPITLFLIICFFVGIYVTITNISVNTMFQQSIPKDSMGRVGSVSQMLMTITVPIGQMLTGFLFDVLPPGLVVVIIGIILLITMKAFQGPLVRATDTPVQTGEVITSEI